MDLVEGLKKKKKKALKLTTYLEENVTGHSVRILLMDAALKGRRETLAGHHLD